MKNEFPYPMVLAVTIDTEKTVITMPCDCPEPLLSHDLSYFPGMDDHQVKVRFCCLFPHPYPCCGR
jgi:hypothetical protein